jgi:hypothetical protein
MKVYGKGKGGLLFVVTLALDEAELSVSRPDRLLLAKGRPVSINLLKTTGNFTYGQV